MDASAIAIGISLVSAVFAGIVAVKKAQSDAKVSEARAVAEAHVAEAKAAMEGQLAILEAQGRIAMVNSKEIKELKEQHEDCVKQHEQCEEKYSDLQGRMKSVEEKINGNH